jgi:2-methylcitrate dehydratase PrpD
VAPARGNIAWSQTGLCGGVGAAVAAGKLLGLTNDQMANAIGIAASQAAGFRAMHATMNLHLMHGRTAPSGLRAALLAKNGLTSSPVAIEGHFGFAEMFSEAPNLAALTDGLGETFELSANTYKPYPCGIVINPVIDACLDLRRQFDGGLDAIVHIRIEVCQAALDLCYRKKPQRPLDAQVSLYHWAAVALARGRASIDGYEPAALGDRHVNSLQDRMDAVLNESLQIDQTIVAMTLKDGRVLKERVEHCIGSQARPMTDQELELKYRNQALFVMSPDRADQLASLCWRLPELGPFKDIVIAVREVS